MGKYDKEFESLIDRTGMSTVKQLFTPDEIEQSGNISLWGAEFEFPCAPFVIDAVTEWAEKGLYAYTVEDECYKETIVSWMSMQRQWEIYPDWVVPVYGITSSLATAMRAFTSEGDGIIGMQPGYHMYWHAVELSGRRRVENYLPYDGERYTIDWDDLEDKMSDPSNKMLLICNPHNPLARVFGPSDVRKIGELAMKYNVIIFSDEIFAECLYDGIELRTFNQVLGNDVRVITATSLGKWQSFTGTNQANLIIPNEELRMAFIAERDREFYGSMNPMMIPAYRAAYSAEGREWLREFMDLIQANYRLASEYFGARIPGFQAVRPEGTFVLWVDATGFCSKMRFTQTESELMKFLIHEARFHVDPGSQYDGNEGFFRMTLSVPKHELEKCLKSLENAVNDSACNLRNRVR